MSDGVQEGVVNGESSRAEEEWGSFQAVCTPIFHN